MISIVVACAACSLCSPFSSSQFGLPGNGGQSWTNWQASEWIAGQESQLNGHNKQHLFLMFASAASFRARSRSQTWPSIHPSICLSVRPCVRLFPAGERGNGKTRQSLPVSCVCFSVDCLGLNQPSSCLVLIFSFLLRALWGFISPIRFIPWLSPFALPKGRTDERLGE